MSDPKGQSPEVQFARALVAFQAEVQAIRRDATNDVYGNGYATLPALHDAIQPLKKKHGLAVMQFPTTLDREPALRTKVLHKSGAFDEDTMLLLTSRRDPQGQGSSLTYGRRYAEMCALGIVAEGEDDDGNAGAGKQTNRRPLPAVKGELPDDSQMRAIFNLLRALKASDDQAAATIAQVNTKLNAALVIQHLRKVVTGVDVAETPEETPPHTDDDVAADPPAEVPVPPSEQPPAPKPTPQLKKDLNDRLGQLGLSDEGRIKFMEWAACKPHDQHWEADDWQALRERIEQAESGKLAISDSWREQPSIGEGLQSELDRTFEVPVPDMPSLSVDEKEEIKKLVESIGLHSHGLIEFIRKVTNGEARFMAGLTDTQWRDLHKAAKDVLNTKEQLPDDWFAGYVTSGKDKAVGS
jgi:hypothetical protein